MKRIPRRPLRRVQFGDPEDILSSSFYADSWFQVSEEERNKAQEIYTRVVTTLRRDDWTMFDDILTEIPDLADVYLERPLAHMAAELGGLKILQNLVSKVKGSVNSVSEDGDATTPLFWAIKEGHAEVVEWLLNNGACHAPLNVSYDNAVYVAVRFNQIKLLDILKAHKCSCNVANRHGDLPLKHVIRVSNIVALEKLAEMEVDLYGWNSQENFRETLLSDALMYQISPCITTVLQCLLDRPSFNSFSHQPMIHHLLIVVIWKDDADALVFLLRLLNPLGEEFDVILTRLQRECIKWPSLKCLREIVKYYGICPSLLASVGKHPSPVFQMLIENDARVIQQKDIVHQCMVSRAAGFYFRYGSNHKNVIAKFHMLIEHGYRMNTSSTDPSGTPVFQVTKSAIPCALLFLLRIGCDVTSPFEGKTPLAQALGPFLEHQTIRAVQLKVAILLIEYLPLLKDPIVQLYRDNYDNSGDPVNLNRDFCVPNYTDGGLCDLLKERSSKPRPLQHLTRILILQTLGINSFKGVHKLGLPKRMVEYVMLEDLEEFVRVVQRTPPSEHISNRCIHLCFN